jgi:hypothetical protein
MYISLLPHRQIETLNILYNFMQKTLKKYFEKMGEQPGNLAASLTISNLKVIQSGINPTFFIKKDHIW